MEDTGFHVSLPSLVDEWKPITQLFRTYIHTYFFLLVFGLVIRMIYVHITYTLAGRVGKLEVEHQGLGEVPSMYICM
jgi:hypothetical protein